MSIHISHDTIQEMKEALFPQTKGMMMSEHAVRFIIDQSSKNEQPQCDIATLQKFIAFLKDKNYN